MASDLLSEYLKFEKYIINDAFVREQAILTGRQPHHIQQAVWDSIARGYSAVQNSFERLENVAKEKQLKRIKEEQELFAKKEQQPQNEQRFIEDEQSILRRLLMQGNIGGGFIQNQNPPRANSVRSEEQFEEHMEQESDTSERINQSPNDLIGRLLQAGQLRTTLEQEAINRAILNGHEDELVDIDDGEDIYDDENDIEDERYEGDDELSGNYSETSIPVMSNNLETQNRDLENNTNAQTQNRLSGQQGNQQNTTQINQGTQNQQTITGVTYFVPGHQWSLQPSPENSPDPRRDMLPNLPRRPNQ